jgi:hypothetical protein
MQIILNTLQKLSKSTQELKYQIIEILIIYKLLIYEEKNIFILINI